MLRKGDLARLRLLSAADWLLLAESTLWLAVARTAVLAIPFRWTRRLFGLHPAGPTTEIIPARTAAVDSVRCAITRVAARTPWDSNCLAQALAGSAMLRLRGIPSTLILGVARNQGEAGDLAAHAWLACGGRILTGAAGHEKFQPVGTFSAGRPSS